MAIARRLLVAAALCLALAVPAVMGQAAAAAPKAAHAGPPNVTAILEKGGVYSTFIRLMKGTQQDTQLNGQLNGTTTGFTVFAPTDNAFSILKPGTLNGLSQQDQVSLVQAHIVPKYYTMDAFETASNPVRTQASGADGPYTLNITATSNSQAINVSTGVVTTTFSNALSTDQLLAVYSVDKVLLPNALFGPKPPPSPPPPPGANKKPSNGSSSASAEAPTDSVAHPAGAAPVGAMAAGWGLAALMAAAYLL
ncbi:hypothetical protein GUJ93_ZPchr0010g7504 [Zizania palustris]|uniref:FAS1 domain-containing protein n=1 Tax=Zizania palustris TaxID=103762 RepID=A0A8J5WDG8_ZIZPA|nr:hypothetical protein GUJ93_ZPchr0010g7504 [Zizania palustris]